MYEPVRLDTKRLLISILFDIGWVGLFAGVVMYMLSGAQGLSTTIISTMFLLTLASALIIIIGLIIRITHMTRKFSGELSKKQLIIGMALMMIGSLAAGIFSLVSVIADVKEHYETGIFFAAQCIMCVGGFMSFVFGLPIMRSLIKHSSDSEEEEP